MTGARHARCWRAARRLRVLGAIVMALTLALPLTVAAQSSLSVSVNTPSLVLREETFNLDLNIQGTSRADNYAVDVRFSIPGGCGEDSQFSSVFTVVSQSIGSEESLAAFNESFTCEGGVFKGVWGPTKIPPLGFPQTFTLLVSSGAPVGNYTAQVTVYDLGGDESASASDTFRVLPGIPESLTLEPVSWKTSVGSQVTLTATIDDAGGEGIEDIPVTFQVSGANTASGTVETDGDGKASFSYTGHAAGTDIVYAFVDFDGTGAPGDSEIAASATIVWLGPDEIDDSLRPFFETLQPAPHSTSPSGEVTVGAVARANSPIVEFTLWLNGEELNPEIGGESETHQSAFTGLDLEPGVYTATARVVDADGRAFMAQWDFVISDDPLETQWFTGDGDPKADEINATMRSLVEAFRYHLYGESWDGQEHPAMPTHAEEITTAEPLGVWVTGTTFDEEYTEATLRSLVEAFRWHFWGESWENKARCDIPTHVDCAAFTGPTPIDPWFENGEPIPENIEATLRSLVEAFRWHFWGYSWDGDHHFDAMPTHAYDD